MCVPACPMCYCGYRPASCEGCGLGVISDGLSDVNQPGGKSCEVFRIAEFGCAVAFGAELLVVADEVGSVKWYRVLCFEGCKSASV